MTYPIHSQIDSEIPYYSESKGKICKKKIQEIMSQYEYDEELIENVDDAFCQGFGIARDIIISLLKEKYYNE